MLCKFKVLKLGQNLHTNMEGFCRASHIATGIYMLKLYQLNQPVPLLKSFIANLLKCRARQFKGKI